jgi:hypothetical protein
VRVRNLIRIPRTSGCVDSQDGLGSTRLRERPGCFGWGWVE